MYECVFYVGACFYDCMRVLNWVADKDRERSAIFMRRDNLFICFSSFTSLSLGDWMSVEFLFDGYLESAFLSRICSLVARTITQEISIFVEHTLQTLDSL